MCLFLPNICEPMVIWSWSMRCTNYILLAIASFFEQVPVHEYQSFLIGLIPWPMLGELYPRLHSPIGASHTKDSLKHQSFALVHVLSSLNQVILNKHFVICRALAIFEVCHAPILGPTQLADPNRVRSARTYTETLYLLNQTLIYPSLIIYQYIINKCPK